MCPERRGRGYGQFVCGPAARSRDRAWEPCLSLSARRRWLPCQSALVVYFFHINTLHIVFYHTNIVHNSALLILRAGRAQYRSQGWERGRHNSATTPTTASTRVTQGSKAADLPQPPQPHPLPLHLLPFGEIMEQHQTAAESLQQVPGHPGMTREEVLREEALMKQRMLAELGQDTGYKNTAGGAGSGLHSGRDERGGVFRRGAVEGAEARVDATDE